MANFFKKLHPLAYCLCLSALLSLVAMIIYIVNGTTGYGTTTSVNGWVVFCFIACIVIEVALFVFSGKIPAKFAGVVISLGLFICGACLTVPVYFWVNMAVQWASDVWFLANVKAVDASEAASLYTALAGIIITFVAFIALVVGSIPATLTKEEKAVEAA